MRLLKEQWKGSCLRRRAEIRRCQEAAVTTGTTVAPIMAKGELRLSGLVLNLQSVNYLEQEMQQLCRQQEENEAKNSYSTAAANNKHNNKDGQQQEEEHQQQKSSNQTKSTARLFEGLLMTHCRFAAATEEEDENGAPEAVERFADLMARYIAKRVVIIGTLVIESSSTITTTVATRQRQQGLSCRHLQILLLRGIQCHPTVESLLLQGMKFVVPTLGSSSSGRWSWLSSLGKVFLDLLWFHPTLVDWGFQDCTLNQSFVKTMVADRSSSNATVPNDSHQRRLRTLVVGNCDIDDDETMALLVRHFVVWVKSPEPPPPPPTPHHMDGKTTPRPPPLEALTLTYHELSPAVLELLVHVLETQTELKCLGLTQTSSQYRPSRITTNNNKDDDHDDDNYNHWLFSFRQALRRHAHLQSISCNSSAGVGVNGRYGYDHDDRRLFSATDPLIVLVQRRNYWLWRIRNLCNPQLRRQQQRQRRLQGHGQKRQLSQNNTTSTIRPMDDDDDDSSSPLSVDLTTHRAKEQKEEEKQRERPLVSPLPMSRKRSHQEDQKAMVIDSPTSVLCTGQEEPPKDQMEGERSSTIRDEEEINEEEEDEDEDDCGELSLLPATLWSVLLEQLGRHCTKPSVDAASPIFFFLKLNLTELQQQWEQQQQHRRRRRQEAGTV